MSKRKTAEQFIEEANKVHNFKYDYSLINYKNNHTKIKIICHELDEFNNEHGVFEQVPFTHINGSGCPKCSKKYKLTTEDFIKLSKLKFKDSFDYTETKYINFSTKVKIKCKKHNLFFETLPSIHLQKDGCCPECKKESVSKLFKVEPKTFFENCKKIHNNKYNYTNSIYLGSHNYIEYICPLHGQIKQIAYYHSQGAGCPYCKTSKGEEKIISYFKEKNINYERQKKFEDLKDIDLLSYDFYLKDRNLLVEYNGEQHYKFIERFHKNYHGFLIQKHHDWLKRKYALKHNINLLVIPYWDYKNINDILRSLK